MSLNPDYDVEVACDDVFTVVTVRNTEGANLARCSIENELVPVILAALMELYGVEGDDGIVQFFPICADCPCEHQCLNDCRCFLQDAIDCEA